MVERLHFEDQIAKNKIKSVILLGIIIVVFVLIGYIIALILDPSFFFIIMILSIVISLLYTWFGYYNSDKIALASVGAKPASQTAHRQLYHAVENMALASGLPMPRVYVMQAEQINAFASGRNPAKAVICVTTGALDKLSKQELEGVIAHEMAHIANFDIRFMTLATVLIGMISIAAEILLRSMWFSSSDNRDSRSGAILLIVSIVVAILAPILAQLVALAISRKREFTADATGVKFTRYPKGLSSALRKIKGDHVSGDERKRFSKETAPLFMSDPYRNRVANLFMTHPPIDERIRRLEAM
ncbi:MAG: M48 family metallopeptidase [Nanoarchaeota archaeon]